MVEKVVQTNHSSPPVAVPEGQTPAYEGTAVAATGVATVAVPIDARGACLARWRRCCSSRYVPHQRLPGLR